MQSQFWSKIYVFLNCIKYLVIIVIATMLVCAAGEPGVGGLVG